MPVTYRRVIGAPAKTVRSQPDPRLERSKRWQRVDAPKPTPPATAGDEKET